MSCCHAVLRMVLIFFMLLFHTVVNSADFSAPLIVLPFNEALEDSAGYKISARVTDDGGIETVSLHYRTIGSEDDFQVIPLVPDRSEGFYSVVLPADQLLRPGIEYYVEAKDRASNISQEPFPDQPRQVFYASAQAPVKTGDAGSSTKKWWWIGLGVLATGALLAAANNDGGDSGDTGATLSIEAPAP